MRKSTESMTGSRPRRRSGPGTVRPGLIVSMSFRLAIPRRVGLHQSPLPLRQPPAIVRYTRFASRGFFIERRTHSYLFVSALGPTPCSNRSSRASVVSEGRCKEDVFLVEAQRHHLHNDSEHGQ